MTTPRDWMFALLIVIALPVRANDIIEALGYKWVVPNASDWKSEENEGIAVLHLIAARGPLPGPRRPIQFAVAQTPEFQRVTLDLDARPLEKSLVIVFAYRDDAHFDYAHLSIDRATSEPHHNGIFHVYGGERVRISDESGPAAFSVTKRWFHVRLTYDGKSGSVEVLVDGKAIPSLHAIDLSLHSGKVGVGSFDETADFKNIKIEGVPAEESQSGSK